MLSESERERGKDNSGQKTEKILDLLLSAFCQGVITCVFFVTALKISSQFLTSLHILLHTAAITDNQSQEHKVGSIYRHFVAADVKLVTCFDNPINQHY